MGSRTAAQAAKVLETPHGTCSIVINAPRGYMEIFTEHDPDPQDWAIVCGLLDRVMVEDIGEPDLLSGVYVWKISFRPAVAPEPDPALCCNQTAALTQAS